jgi:hypothetical protein
MALGLLALLVEGEDQLARGAGGLPGALNDGAERLGLDGGQGADNGPQPGRLLKVVERGLKVKGTAEAIAGGHGVSEAR